MAAPLYTDELKDVLAPMLSKSVKYELQQNRNPLEKLVMGETMAPYTTQNVWGKIELSKVTRGFETPGIVNLTDASRLPPTPADRFPEMKRRASSSVEFAGVVPCDTGAAKALGISTTQLASELNPVLTAATKRASLMAILEGLVTPQYENPIVMSGKAAGSWAVHPVAQNLLAPKVTANSKESFPLTIETFNEFVADFSDACSVPVVGEDPPMDQSIGTGEKILIFSNQGYQDFVNANLHIMGNQDYFGKPVVFGGTGTIRSWQGFNIITLPTDQFLKYATPTATPTYNEIQWASASDADLTASDSYVVASGPNSALHTKTKQASYYTNKLLHQVIGVVTTGLQFYYPAQFMSDTEEFKDQLKSLEKKLFLKTGIEARKDFDKAVWRVFYSRKPRAAADWQAA